MMIYIVVSKFSLDLYDNKKAAQDHVDAVGEDEEHKPLATIFIKRTSKRYRGHTGKHV